VFVKANSENFKSLKTKVVSFNYLTMALTFTAKFSLGHFNFSLMTTKDGARVKIVKMLLSNFFSRLMLSIEYN